jgi:3-phosphoshikimate 1-carboxyvinyltransferase
MEYWKIRKAPRIISEIRVPGDKSISHRAVILSSLSNGECVIRGFLPSEDCLRTVEAMRALGVNIEAPEETTLNVHGNRGMFSPPLSDIDCGNSGTTMRLLAGLLAAQRFRVRLIGDESLSRRPMRRIMDPLQQMGAMLRAEGAGDRPPLIVEGKTLSAIDYASPVASAQVKSAILLAAMQTRGRTTVTEPAPSRNHTERMFEYFLVNAKVAENSVSIIGPQTPESRDFIVPGDISSAAFWLVAAAARKGSHLLVEDVGLNDTRTGVLAVLVRMGARVREVIEKEVEAGEPRGTIEIQGTHLHGTVIRGQEIPNVIDEIPILAVAGALASGTTVIADARELRVKETDRIATVAENLRAMGVMVEETEDGMKILGGAKLHGARMNSFGDHRIAMAFAIAGLFAEGDTIIENVECVKTSYPGFLETLEKIVKESRHQQTRVITSLPNHEKGERVRK